ncbi:hypothetical protein F5146DRAFT_938323, partial [Armillaria mellea]
EPVLHPDDTDGFAQLKSVLPQTKFSTGEVHTVSLPSPACRHGNSGIKYTKDRVHKLIEGRNIDILQSDVMEVRGTTELVKITTGGGVRPMRLLKKGCFHESDGF